MKSYELGVAKTSGNPYIKCLRCNRESYNQNDIDNRFCPKCGFHDDLFREDLTGTDKPSLSHAENPGYDPYDHDISEK